MAEVTQDAPGAKMPSPALSSTETVAVSIAAEHVLALREQLLGDLGLFADNVRWHSDRLLERRDPRPSPIQIREWFEGLVEEVGRLRQVMAALDSLGWDPQAEPAEETLVEADRGYLELALGKLHHYCCWDAPEPDTAEEEAVYRAELELSEHVLAALGVSTERTRPRKIGVRGGENS